MQQDSTAEMPTMIVKRWARYGHDRLFVATEDGQRVGWFDLLTNQTTVELPEFTNAFTEALSSHQRDLGGLLQAASTRAPQHVTEPSTTLGVAGSLAPPPALLGHHQVAPPVHSWTDLALNRPGQRVRAEAESLLAEMKATSKFRTFVTRAMDAKTDERAFRVGAAGEESVGARLDRLTKYGWHVLHSFPVGQRGSDIDHLVITKGGVYPINTKRHPGGKVWVGEKAILVNGQKTDYLRNSRYEGDRVRKTVRMYLAPLWV